MPLLLCTTPIARHGDRRWPFRRALEPLSSGQFNFPAIRYGLADRASAAESGRLVCEIVS